MQQVRSISNRICFRRSLYHCGLFFLIGFCQSAYLVIIPVLLISILIFGANTKLMLRSNSILFFFIYVFFGLSYILFYKNPMHNDAVFDFNSFGIVIYVFVIFIILFSEGNFFLQIQYLKYFSFGVLCFQLIYIVPTVLFISPPYRGNIFDPFSGELGNSPGISNLILLYSISIVLFNFSRKINKIDWLILLLLFIFQMLLAQRTGIIISLFLFLFSGIITRNKVVVWSIVFVTLVFVTTLFKVIIDRFQSEQLKSSRMELAVSFFNQVLADPLSHPKVDQSIDRVEWFHNWLLDTYKTSGFLSFTIATILSIFPIFRWLGSRYKFDRIVWQCFVAYTLVLLISLVSVPLEGDKSVFIFFILCGNILVNVCKTAKSV